MDVKCIKIMNLQLKQQVIQKYKDFYFKVVRQTKPIPFILNVSLTSNPFLKDKQAFKLLKFHLNEYNKRVQKGQVKDPYEMLSYQKMHSMLSDVALMQTRDDQIVALDDIGTWFKDQSRLLQQRQDQGEIRYQMSKQYREALKNLPTKEVTQQQKELQIPFYIIERIMQPYIRHSRTLHPQLDAPDRRLLDFKGKTINIPAFADQKDQIKPTRVLYPRPPKYEPPKQQQPQIKPADQQLPIQGVPAQGQPIQGAPQGQQQAATPQQPGMDLGIGQQPQQPDEDEPPEDVPDKLRPKNPIYVDPVSTDRQKKYKEGYMFYEGNQTKQQRNMDLRYLRKYQNVLRKQRQEVQQIQIAHQWGRKKSKMTKDIQRKLEQFKFKPQFSFSTEPMVPEERLAPQDEFKYGLTTIVRQKNRFNQVDITLPQLRNNKTLHQFQQKSIRKERLNSLKSKFSKVLNLTEHQQRQSAPSLCQFTARRRGLSEIIRNHSQSKQRLNQIQEVAKIKQKLTKVKVNINIKALAKGLCLPQDQHYFSETTRQFPSKQLPSNPDLIEKKKKKKKK